MTQNNGSVKTAGNGTTSLTSAIVAAIIKRKTNLVRKLMTSTSLAADVQALTTVQIFRCLVAACGNLPSFTVQSAPQFGCNYMPCPIILQEVLDVLGVDGVGEFLKLNVDHDGESNFALEDPRSWFTLDLLAILLYAHPLPDNGLLAKPGSWPDKAHRCRCDRSASWDDLSNCVRVLLQHGAKWNARGLRLFRQVIGEDAKFGLSTMSATTTLWPFESGWSCSGILPTRENLPEDFNPFEMGEVKATWGTS
ncbi:hypothetical protein OQA88_3051 [Cercophora sp. LCS_1]